VTQYFLLHLSLAEKNKIADHLSQTQFDKGEINSKSKRILCFIILIAAHRYSYVLVVHSRAFGFYPLGGSSDSGQVRIDALYQRCVLLPDLHGNTANTARFSPFYFRFFSRLSRVLSHYSRNRDVSWIGVRAIQQSASDRGGFTSNTFILPDSSFRTPFLFNIPRRALITERVSWHWTPGLQCDLSLF